MICTFFVFEHLYKHINIYILIDTSIEILTFHPLCYIIIHVKKGGPHAKAYQKTIINTLHHLSRILATKLFRRGHKCLPRLQAHILPDLPLYGLSLGPRKALKPFARGSPSHARSTSIYKAHHHYHDYGYGEDTSRAYGAHEQLKISFYIITAKFNKR